MKFIMIFLLFVSCGSEDSIRVNDGKNGNNGVDGAIGPAGSDGSNGSSGSAGPVGANGETGLTGPLGPVGPAGEAGPIGLQGPIGPVGPNGEPGMPPEAQRFWICVCSKPYLKRQWKSVEVTAAEYILKYLNIIEHRRGKC